MEFRYREGATAETAVVKDLSSGYSLRMDIVVPATKERIYTFNTEALADVDPGAPTVPDSVVDATLTSGAGGTANITIVVPRSLTLPGGAVYTKYTANPPVALFNYDAFLRHTASNRQVKVIKGTITIGDSFTLWP